MRKTFLQEIRQRLEDELTRLRGKGRIPESQAIDTSEVKKDPDANVAIIRDAELNLALLERRKDRIREIARTLQKLNHGEFGNCEECGERINPRRLEAIPTATFCVGCQDRFEVEARRQQSAPVSYRNTRIEESDD